MPKLHSEACALTNSSRLTPQVTIGLPFTNQPLGQFMGAVRSVFGQTHQNWTLILVADRASHENVAYARSIKDARVRVEVFDEQRGLARRLNEVAAMAETPYLFRMDADDIMHAERVARQLAVLESDTADLIGSRAYLIDGSDRVYGRMKEPPGVPPTAHKYLANRPILMHPTLAAKAAWFRAHPYDETLLRAQDKALFISAASSTRMVKMPESLLFYRVLRPIPPRRQTIAYKFDRSVVRKYGSMVASRPTVLGYVLQSHVKQRVFQVLSHFGGEDYLFERKIDPLNGKTQGQAERALRSALSSPVPGWPAPFEWNS